MRRVLIADGSEILIQLIAKACFADDEVYRCTDGHSALEMLVQHRPEIFLLNLSLPYKDGLAVLREAVFLPRRVIAMTYLSDPHILRELEALGVQYVLHMPTADGVRQALATVEARLSGVRTDLRGQTVFHLQQLGISPKLQGYQMLVVGLPIFCRDPAQLLDKELYPAIVCAMGQGSTASVERSVRQAIRSGWKNRTDRVWRQYFPVNARGEIRCPTVKSFLKVLAPLLEAQCDAQEEKL